MATWHSLSLCACGGGVHGMSWRLEGGRGGVEEGDSGRRRRGWEISPELVSGERRTNTSFVVRKTLGTKGEFEFHFRSVEGIVKRQFSDRKLN